MIKKFYIIGTCLIFLTLSACSDIAVFSIPKKKPIPSQSKLAKQAETQFWNTLHQGRYEKIALTEKLLTAAYLENPNDPKLAAHLGFLHIWKITERQRGNTIPPTIVNSIILSKKYFSDAVALNPSDARYLGFLGDTQLVTGKIFNDERQQTRGYFTLKQSIHDWPEFNYFTAGYPMTILPADSHYFNEAVEWQWKTLDLCAHTHVDRKNPDFSPYMRLETLTPPKSACWNSWITPYNFEGFFLNMGDMLVKKGDWQTALVIYHNAKLAKNYSSWPHRFLLENHIKYAKENVILFNQDSKTHFSSEKILNKKMRINHTMLFNSGYGCVACHSGS